MMAVPVVAGLSFLSLPSGASSHCAFERSFVSADGMSGYVMCSYVYSCVFLWSHDLVLLHGSLT